MANESHKDIPLNGKLITADPATIGTNFRTLTNMEYTDTHVRGIRGMTKINSSALTTYLKVRNAFHYYKAQPQESHLMVQAYNDGLTASRILQNTTAIPNTGNFSATPLWTDSAGAGQGFFSDAPNGQVAYCNGVDACLWSGDEDSIARFVNFNPDQSFWYDFTDKVNNTLTDSANIATLKRVAASIGASTKALYHLDNAVTDSSGNGHTLTNSNVTFSNSDYVFGTHSAVFNGTNAELSILDHADFDLSGGTFTIDARIKVTSLAANNPIYYQNTTNNDDSFKFYVDTNGALHLLIIAAAVTVVELVTPNNTISVNTWYHVALVESGDNYYIFAGPTAGTASLLAYTTDVSRAANYTGTVHFGYGLVGVGAGSTEWYSGKMDEIRISNAAIWTTSYQVPLSAYGSTTQTFVWVASRRKADAFKFYVGTANTASGTVTGYEWNGSGLAALSSVTDGTSSAGKTLAQTGSISFTSTVSTSKLKMIREVIAFYYLFVFDSIDDNVTVTHCTASQPMQQIVDIWDGVKRDVSKFYKYTTTYTDLTTNVLRKEYEASTTYTYAQIGSLATDQCLYCQSAERLQGLFFDLPDSLYVNTTANTVILIDYYNGQSWVSVGAIEDGTSTGAISIKQPGSVTWQQQEDNIEFPTVINNNMLEYYSYRIRFSQALSADVRIDYISGIPASKTIGNYKFSINAQGRLLLCSEMSENKNKITCSGKNLPDVYNGFDSADVFIGDKNELTCGAELFSNFGSSLYSIILLFKDNETWIITGQDIDSWGTNTFIISSSIGCPAPLTLKTINLAADPGGGINRSLAIWQGANGIFMSDGRAPVPIHNDIKEFFDPTYSRYINRSKIGDSVSWVDTLDMKWHWKFASGASTTLNEELVYDIKRNKWFEIDRGTGKSLQCGVEVYDTDGNTYTYGFLDTGYCERLNYGTTFDGNDITHTMWFGDILLNDKLSIVSRIKRIKTIMAAKTVTTNTLAITHYGDTRTAGQSYTGSVAAAGQRIAISTMPVNYGDFLFHSLKYVMVTNNETIGFEPLAVSIFYENIMER